MQRTTPQTRSIAQPRHSQEAQRKVRRLAGLATWIAGILPQINAYTSRLWAATSGSSSYRALPQIKIPVRWLRALCGTGLEQRQHHCRATPGYFSLITFDASLTGGGASLQEGLQSLEQAATKPIVAYWHARWTRNDLRVTRVKPGDPSGQAALEAYTLLVSVSTWMSVLKQAQGALHVRGDALGILHNMMRFRAKDPVLNAIAGELAYLVAPLGLDIHAAHIWSERNFVCVKLSRLRADEAADLPELSGAARVKRRPIPNILLSSLVGT